MTPRNDYADIKQRGDQWAHLRWNVFFTASQFGGALGMNPFQTPTELFKQYVKRTRQAETPPMTWGTFMEDRARKMLEVVLKDQYVGTTIEIKESGLWWNDNWPELGKYLEAH